MVCFCFPEGDISYSCQAPDMGLLMQNAVLYIAYSISREPMCCLCIWKLSLLKSHQKVAKNIWKQKASHKPWRTWYGRSKVWKSSLTLQKNWEWEQKQREFLWIYFNLLIRNSWVNSLKTVKGEHHYSTVWVFFGTLWSLNLPMASMMHVRVVIKNKLW